MPGRLFLTTPIAEILPQSGLNLPSETGISGPPRANIQPGQNIVVFSTQGASLMRWGLIPVGRKNARGRPVMETIINARSESVFDKSAFEGVKRAVIPADGWYEWTGKKRRKIPWRIRRKDGAPIWFAAIYDIWNGPAGVTLPQVAAVTCAPNADVAHVHHRMGVLLPPSALAPWLGADEAAAKSVMIQPPAGDLKVEPADDVDWSGQ